MLRRRPHSPPPGRRGTVMPMFAIVVFSLFGFVALAIDLGLLAVARTECQTAADAAALAGARKLNNIEGANSNITAAEADARDAPTRNKLFQSNFTAGSVSEVSFGLYEYDTASGQFVPNFTSAPGPGQSYTAARVVVRGTKPAYFSKVFGVGDLPTQARAVAIHRPRDIAMVLDATGSMRFGTTLCAYDSYMSADPSYPKFGPYQRYDNYAQPNPNYSSTYYDDLANRHNPFFTTVEYQLGTDGAYAPNNYTVPTRGGPACVKDFYFDPANLASPATPVAAPSSALVSDGDTTMPRAFHHWDPAEVSAGDPDNYVAPTYGFGSWNGVKDVNNFVLFPTPYAFEDQSDANYLGDRHPRKSGKQKGTGAVAATTGWDPLTPTGAAVNLAEYLAWLPPITSGAATPRPDSSPPATPAAAVQPNRNYNNFRDATWEKYGYDLDVKKYLDNRGTTDPRTVLAVSGVNLRVPTSEKFKGYSVGPGYWGKTFFQWPPDPRFGPEVNTTVTEIPALDGKKNVIVMPAVVAPNPTSISSTDPVKDTAGNWICDWRRRFFLDKNGNPFDPQTDADPDAGGVQGINEVLLNVDGTVIRNYNGKAKVNYPAVLKWLKSPPMTLPPNLRAGRVVYYTSIPDDVDGGSDGAFWRAYIDYVLNPPTNDSSINQRETRDWPEGATADVANADPVGYKRTGTGATTDPKPYMNYLGNPSRPRAQTWFGPITMMAFLAEGKGNTWAGTVHESQTWQLKAGMASVLRDIRNNHPNDAVGLTYFSRGAYGRVAVALGQEWKPLNDALFYPLPLVDDGNVPTPTTEFAAFDSSANNRCGSRVPNAQGGTDANTGMAMAFNILTPSTQSGIRGPTTLPTPYFTRNRPQSGRRGASKIVLFETDGVPNGVSDVSVQSGGGATYYKVDNLNAGSASATDAGGRALEVVDQMVKNLADGGLSSDTSPARVYSIGFGDLFSSGSSGQIAARSFLLQVQKRGKTSGPSDGAIPPSQIITGPAQTRIDSLRTCLERIMQSGVQVTLIE